MPFGTPTDPVAATVITVAYAVANFLDPIRWLRAMTGNADPPGSDYVVRSTSTTATTWSRVTTDVLANLGVTTAKLADLAVTNGKIADDTIVGDAKIAGSTITGYLPDSPIGTNVIHPNRLRTDAFDSAQVANAFASGAFNNANIVDLFVDNAIPGDTKIANSSITGYLASSAIATNSVHGNRLRGGSIDGTEFGRIFTDGCIGTAKIADGNITRAKMAADAVAFAHLYSDDTPADGDFVTVNTATGKFEFGTPAAVAGVPSGLIALWDAASPPTGYTIYTPTAGRFVVGAGGTLGLALNATGGSATHQHDLQNHVHDHNHSHAIPDHNHGAAALSVGGSTAGPTGTGTGGGTGATFADGSHTHAVGSLDVGGNTDNRTGLSTNNLGTSPVNVGAASPNSTNNLSTLPPYVALHYIKKS